MTVPCREDMKELKGGHYQQIVEVTENAGKCLLVEYAVRNFSYELLIVLTPRTSFVHIHMFFFLMYIGAPLVDEEMAFHVRL